LYVKSGETLINDTALYKLYYYYHFQWRAIVSFKVPVMTLPLPLLKKKKERSYRSDAQIKKFNTRAQIAQPKFYLIKRKRKLRKDWKKLIKRKLS